MELGTQACGSYVMQCDEAAKGNLSKSQKEKSEEEEREDQPATAEHQRARSSAVLLGPINLIYFSLF